MAPESNGPSARPIVVGPGTPPIAAVGTSLMVHECTDSGPLCLRVHRSDDEAWYVLSGSLRFRFVDGDIDAPAGTAHTYRVAQPNRYSIFLTPRLDQLIARLRKLEDRSEAYTNGPAF
jgi:hypothetical protein